LLTELERGAREDGKCQRGRMREKKKYTVEGVSFRSKYWGYKSFWKRETNVWKEIRS